MSITNHDGVCHLRGYVIVISVAVNMMYDIVMGGSN